MALKRKPVPPPMKRPAATTTADAGRKPVVPPPAKKAVPAPDVRKAFLKQSVEDNWEALEKMDDIPKPTPTRRPVRKPTVPPVQPKDVKTHEPEETEIQPQRPAEVIESPKAPEPDIASRGEGEPAEPRPISTRAQALEGRVSSEALRDMNFTERYELFKKLNRSHENFVPLLRDLPMKMQMRLDEARLRKIVGDAPKGKEVPKGAVGIYYCPYCVDWQVFHYHSWTGYEKCCGCSISNRDFYTLADNKLYDRGE